MNLLPCPFCGGVELQTRSKDVSGSTVISMWNAQVSCLCCGAKGTEAAQDNWLNTEEEAESEAIAAWNRRAMPEGFVLVPVESAKFCAEKTKAMAATIEQKWGGYAQDLKSWQLHINALLEAVEQEKKNG